MKKSLSNKLVKIGEAAKLLGVSIKTLRRWDKAGKIEATRTAGGTRQFLVENFYSKPQSTEELLKRTQKINIPVIARSEATWQSTQSVEDSSLVTRNDNTKKSFITPILLGIVILSLVALALVLRSTIFSSKLQKIQQFSQYSNVLAATTGPNFLEVNSDTQINGSLFVRDSINGLSLEATPSAGTIALNAGTTTLTITKTAKLDQDVSTAASPAFNTLNLSGTKNQLVFQSGGPTGTLTWTPTAARIITLPDVTTTLVGIDNTQTLTNKSMSGSSNTFTNLPNSAFANSKITINAGTNLSGGGDVNLGSSITLSLLDSPSITGTLTVGGTTTLSGATTLSSTLNVAGATTLSSSLAVTGTSVFTGVSTFLSTLSLGNSTTAGGDFSIYENASGNKSLFFDASAAMLTISKNLVNDFSQVSTDGLGDITNTAIVSSEHFNNYYYVGTSKAAAGAEIWRTSDGTTLTQVNTDGFADANNIQISWLQEFNGYLYAGTNNSTTGTEIWRTKLGSQNSDWSQVNTDGFGDVNNTKITAMTVFDGYLYAATNNSSTGVEMWRTKLGSSQYDWVQVNTDGFADANNTAVGDMAVFDGYLYIITNNATTGVKVFRTQVGSTQNDWLQVNDGGFAAYSSNSTGNSLVTYNGYLYAGVGGTNSAQVWRTAIGSAQTDWSKVNSNGFSDTNNTALSFLRVFNGYLYAGTNNSSTGAEVWRTNVGSQNSDWTQINTDGFGSANNTAFSSDSVSDFNGYFYLGTTNTTSGGSLQRIQTGLIDLTTGALKAQGLQIQNTSLQNNTLTGLDNIISQNASFNTLGVSSELNVGNAIKVNAPNLTLLGSVGQSGTTQTINVAVSTLVSGNYAYNFNLASNTMTVVDISTPTSPTVVASLTDQRLGSYNYRPAISGNYIYVAGMYSNRLTVINIQNPTKPTIVGSLLDSTNLSSSNYGVTVSGNYAYVTSSTNNRLTIIDISDPTNPIYKGKLVDAVNLANAHFATVSGNYVYVAAYDTDRLTIIDVTDPTTPVLKGSVTNSQLDGAYDVALSGNYAYVAAYLGKRVTVVDVTDLTAPTVYGSVQDTTNLANANSINISGSYAYVGTWSTGRFTVVNISTPSSPAVSASIKDNNYLGSVLGYSFALSGNYAYVPQYYASSGTPKNYGGMAVIDISAPTSPVITGFTGSSDLYGSTDVLLKGGYAFVTNQNEYNITVWDVSNPGSITYITTLYLDSSPLFGAIKGDYLYVAHTSGTKSLSIINVADPKHPFLAKGYVLGGYSPTKVRVKDNYLFVVASGNDSLSIYDISNPLNPTLVSALTDSTNLDGAYDIQVRGNFAYVAASVGNRITVVDISNPQKMKVVGSIQDNTVLKTTEGIVLIGNYVYGVARGNNYIYAVDVTNPASPTVKGSLTDSTYTYYLRSIDKINDQYLVVARDSTTANTNSSYLSLVDVSNPASPKIINSYLVPAGGAARNVVVEGNRVYAASGFGTFSIYEAGGIDSPAGYIGSLRSNQLTVTSNASVDGALDIGDGLRVGGGAYIGGTLGIHTENWFNQNAIALNSANSWNSGNALDMNLAATKLDAVYLDNGSLSYTNNTTEANSSGGTAYTLLADTNDRLYFGAASPFSTINFDIATAANTALTLNWEYSITGTDYLYNGTTYADNSTEANTEAGTPYTLLGDNVDDKFYFGADDKFDAVNIDIATAADTALTLNADYWNGSAWTTLTKTDGTTGLTADGQITFTPPSDWQKTSVNSVSKYYIRIYTATVFATPPTANFSMLWVPLPYTTDGTSGFTVDGKFSFQSPYYWNTLPVNGATKYWVRTSTTTSASTWPTANFSTISMFSGNFLNLANNGTTSLVINSSGNLGIGTTNPGNNLSVVGITSVTGTASVVGTSSVVGTFSVTGNVGIGTTQPASPLVVTAPTTFLAGTLATISAPASGLTGALTGLNVNVSGTAPGSVSVASPTTNPISTERISDPSFESGTGGFSGYSGATVVQDTVPHTGTYSIKLSGPSGNPSTDAVRNSIAVNTWVKASIWIKSSGSVNGRLYILDNTHTRYLWNPAGSSSTTYTQNYMGIMHDITTSYDLYLQSNDSSGSIWYDDISLQVFTLSSLFSNLYTLAPNVTAQVGATIATGAQAGVVVNLDSSSSPANFVIGYYDKRTGNAVLEKVVAGVYTTLINTTTAYSAGAIVKVVNTGSVYQLWYNGSQIGGNQTITDTGIINNTLHGILSTDATNTFSNLSLTAATQSITALNTSAFTGGGDGNTNYGLNIGSVTGSGTSTNYGAYIGTISGGSTNNIGLRITGTAAAATNYAIYADSAATNYFAGNVGIGTTNPGNLLTVFGGNVGIGTTANVNAALSVMGGNVGIGTTVPTAQLELSGATAIKSSGTAWDNPSDIRLKNIVGDYTYGLNEIMQINPVIFTFKEDNALGINDPGEHIGIVAQEVQQVIPEAVITDSAGFLRFRLDPVLWATINAVKELNAKIATSSSVLASFSVSADGTLNVPKLKAGTIILDPSIASTSAQLLANSSSSVIPAEAGIYTNIYGSLVKPGMTSGDISYDLTGKIASLEDRIKSLEEKIATSSATPSAQTSSEVGLDSSEVSLHLTPPDILLATGSATLANLSVASEATVSGKLTAYDLNIQNSLKSLGETTLGDTIVAGDFSIDGTMSVTGNSINAIGVSQGHSLSTQGVTLTNSGILYLQDSSLAQGVDIFNGKVTIDKNGNIASAGEVKAVSITTNQLTISNIPIASSSATLTPTIGTGKIVAGQISVAITTNMVSDKSKIFITPRNKIGSQALVVESVSVGTSFTVSLDHPLSEDLSFDWWIIDTE